LLKKLWGLLFWPHPVQVDQQSMYSDYFVSFIHDRRFVFSEYSDEKEHRISGLFCSMPYFYYSNIYNFYCSIQNFC